MRFNCKSKGCPRKDDLRKEESEDKRIYGKHYAIQAILIRKYFVCLNRNLPKILMKQDRALQSLKGQKLRI